MTDLAADLTALVSSRICHDLISPLGAIGNGVELLSMAGGPVSPEMALIAESVENANARIRFFRVAFGMVGEGQSLGRSEILAILSAYSRGGRTQIDWQPLGNCLRGEVKLAFLLLLCLDSAMPYGGRVTVSHADRRWTVQGSAPKMRIEPDLWDVLSDPGKSRAVSPAQVHFALVPDTVQALGRSSKVELSETQITLRV